MRSFADHSHRSAIDCEIPGYLGAVPPLKFSQIFHGESTGRQERGGALSNIVRQLEKRGICKEPRYTHRSPRIKRLSRETIREQLARMIHDGRRADERERKRELTGG